MQRRHLLGLLGGAGLAAAAISACDASGTMTGQAPGQAPAGSGRTTRIRYGTASPTPAVDQAPYTSVPLQLGYWAEEGLEVEVMGFSGSGAVFQAIDAGQIDVGQGPPGPLFRAVAGGTSLKAFYDHVPRNFLMPAVPQGSPITSAAQLKGATVGVANLEAGGVTLIKAMAAKAGLTESDYDLVAIGRGAEAAAFIQRGDIDVIELWDSAYVELGIPFTMLRDPYFESIGFHNAIATTAQRLAEQPEQLTGIGRGVAKASVFVQENPEAAVRLHWKQFPESKPVGVEEAKALAAAVAVLEARNVNTTPLEGRGWGFSDDEIVAGHMQMLLDGGVLPEPIEPGELWDGGLITGINEFDAEAIRIQARDQA